MCILSLVILKTGALSLQSMYVIHLSFTASDKLFHFSPHPAVITPPQSFYRVCAITTLDGGSFLPCGPPQTILTSIGMVLPCWGWNHTEKNKKLKSNSFNLIFLVVLSQRGDIDWTFRSNPIRLFCEPIQRKRFMPTNRIYVKVLWKTSLKLWHYVLEGVLPTCVTANSDYNIFKFKSLNCIILYKLRRCRVRSIDFYFFFSVLCNY